jgi:hypothetical protein
LQILPICALQLAKADDIKREVQREVRTDEAGQKNVRS